MTPTSWILKLGENLLILNSLGGTPLSNMPWSLHTPLCLHVSNRLGGGVEANTTIEPVNTKDPFLGSSNRPKWLSLKEDWKERIKLWNCRQRQDEEQVEGHEETKQWEEEEQIVNIAIVNNMFKNIDQRLVPKQYNHQESGEARDELEYIKPPIFEKEIEGEEIKPALFPKELWNLVDPYQRRRVKGRFDKFTDEEYLNSCVEKILNQLDILNR